MLRLGNVIDVSAPILTGVGGYAHVGMDRSVIRAKIWTAVFDQQGLMLLIFLFSVVIAYLLVNRISQPLNLLADHARSLAAADFSKAPNVPASIEALSQTSKDEIGNLAGSFVHMERALQRSIENLKKTTAAKERIESELKIAHDIQMSMVPKIFPPFPNRPEFELYATLEPAREVEEISTIFSLSTMIIFAWPSAMFQVKGSPQLCLWPSPGPFLGPLQAK